MTSIRIFAAALVAFGGVVLQFSSFAQAYPSKTIHIIVPYTVGGSNDLIARMIAKGLTDAFKVAAIVENKPGGSANIGANFVAKAPPDGYTLLITSSSIMSINPYLIPSTPFNPIKDFQPITLLGSQPFVLVANPALKVNSVNELVALAKKRDRNISYASAGPGSAHHMAAELLKSMADIKMTHIPYKGTAPALLDVIGGNVDVIFGPINQLLPHIKSGKLTALAVAGANRTQMLPTVPTVAESIPSFETDAWLALTAPAKTPPEIIAKLNQVVRATMSAPENRLALLDQGIDASTSPPEDVNKLAAIDAARWSKLIREAKISAE
jgi:tripartite-type tricarboxylate transporter receptor subunit TctC